MQAAAQTSPSDDTAASHANPELAKNVSRFGVELNIARHQAAAAGAQVKHSLQGGVARRSQDPSNVLMNKLIIPDEEAEQGAGTTEPYGEEHRTMTTRHQDDQLPVIKTWLKNPFK